MKIIIKELNKVERNDFPNGKISLQLGRNVTILNENEIKELIIKLKAKISDKATDFIPDVSNSLIDFNKLLYDFRGKFINGGGVDNVETFNKETNPYDVFEFFKKSIINKC